MKKDPGMQEFVDGVARLLFGKTVSECIQNKECLACGGEAKTFKDRVSVDEYLISGLCQACQDNLFQKE